MIENIKKFFKKLFNMNYQEKLPEANTEKDCEKTNIRDEIKIEDNIELLKIQNNYENGKISEKNFSKTQIIKLINLYEKQINELNYRITCNKKI